MKNLKKLLSAANHHELLVGTIFASYIFFDVRTPAFLAKLINTTIGNFAIFAMVVSMMSTCNPIICLFGAIAAYVLVKRSEEDDNIAEGTLSEQSRLTNMTKHNPKFSKTLEEEMVQKIKPRTHHVEASTYKPVMDDIKDAAPVDYDGVI